MSLSRFVALLPLALLFTACTTDEGPIPDVLWEPELTSSAGGELDYGVVSVGQSTQNQITGTNNTEDTLTFTVDVDLEVGEGWIVSTNPGPVDILPGEMISIGPTFQANPSTPSESTGTITFFYDNEVVTYLVSATVADD